MIRIIYIGSNEQTISHFKDILDTPLLISNHIKEASKLCSNFPGNDPIIILYERTSLKQDIPNISYLKKKSNRVYIVLVTSDLLKTEEKITYLKNGINDTITPDVEKVRYQKSIEFIIARYEQLLPDFLKSTPLTSFRLPMWKRLFDIIFASIAIIILSPLLIVVAIAIRIESKGKIIYKSKRVQARLPTEFLLQFARVDSVAHIVPHTVGNMSDKVEVFTFLTTEQTVDGVDEDVDDVDVLPLVETADIICVSHLALMEDKVDSASVVFYVQPVANIQAFAINRQWFAMANVVDE